MNCNVFIKDNAVDDNSEVAVNPPSRYFQDQKLQAIAQNSFNMAPPDQMIPGSFNTYLNSMSTTGAGPDHHQQQEELVVQEARGSKGYGNEATDEYICRR